MHQALFIAASFGEIISRLLKLFHIECFIPTALCVKNTFAGLRWGHLWRGETRLGWVLGLFSVASSRSPGAASRVTCQVAFVMLLTLVISEVASRQKAQSSSYSTIQRTPDGDCRSVQSWCSPQEVVVNFIRLAGPTQAASLLSWDALPLASAQEWLSSE